MPGGNRMGPMGAGPMTGRGLGVCAGNTPLRSQSGFGRRVGRGMSFGFGRRRGGGLGFGRGFGASMQNWSDPAMGEGELTALKQESEMLARSLEAIKQRINEIENAQ